jgi:hypothetical protein
MGARINLRVHLGAVVEWSPDRAETRGKSSASSGGGARPNYKSIPWRFTKGFAPSPPELIRCCGERPNRVDSSRGCRVRGEETHRRSRPARSGAALPSDSTRRVRRLQRREGRSPGRDFPVRIRKLFIDFGD